MEETTSGTNAAQLEPELELESKPESKPKRIYTSYFAKAGNMPMAYAISAESPRWLPGLRHFQPLAPASGVVRQYKEGKINEMEYRTLYLRTLQVRGRTPQQVVDMLPDGAILLCYEKPPAFCHRHLAADWLREAGDSVAIEELS